MKLKEIANYYSRNWPIYVKWWKADKTYGIHYGYYEKGIHNHIQSILNMNEFVGKLLDLDVDNKRKKILDAGCGVGGTSIYLAKKYPHITFKGITIVPEELKIANRFAKENRVNSNTDFMLGDYKDTSFPSDYFDGIFALESMSYVEDKKDFIQEMYRILKSDGRLVVIDGFRTNISLNNFIQAAYTFWLKGLMISDLEDLKNFISHLKMEGFKKIEDRDLSKNVRWSVIRGWLISIPHFFSFITKKILLGEKYEPLKDVSYCNATSILTPFLGLSKAITYNAITAVK